MQSINALEYTLKQALGWHKLPVQCLVQIMLGLIAVRSVNLKEYSGHRASRFILSPVTAFFLAGQFPSSCRCPLDGGAFFARYADVSVDRQNQLAMGSIQSQYSDAQCLLPRRRHFSVVVFSYPHQEFSRFLAKKIPLAYPELRLS